MTFIRRRAHLLLSVFALLVVAGTIAYIHSTYFFNPLTFRQNRVLYLPFKFYKNPLQIQVTEIDTTHSTAFRYTTFNPKDVQFVLSQLEKGKVVQQPNYPQTETTVLHVDLRSGAQVDAPILQDAMMQGPVYSTTASIATQTQTRYYNEYITVTPALQQWIQQALKQAKPVSS